MENSLTTFIGLFAKGQCQEQPDVILVTDNYFASNVRLIVESANAMYDSQYGVEGTTEGRIEYIIQALDDAEVPYQNITDNLFRMDL